MLRQLVHRLRGKIAQIDLSSPAGETAPPLQLPHIETIPGLGYGLSLDPETD